MKILKALLVVTLFFSLFTGSFVSAKDLEDTVKSVDNYPKESEFSYSDEGITYHVKSVENEKFITSVVQDDKGYQKFERNKATGSVKVTSNYLSPEEIAETERLYYSVKVDVQDEGLLNPDEDGFIDSQAIKGSFAWSSWQNITITVDDKATITIIVMAITGAIPQVGPLAAPLAGVMVQYVVKVGHFSHRRGTALDTDPQWYWEQTQVRLYKDKAHTVLLSDKTTDPVRYMIQN